MLMMLVVTQSALAAAPDAHWCPGGINCVTYDTLQQAVDAAKAAHTPGIIQTDAGTFTEDVIVNGLKDLIIAGSSSTLNGNLTIDKSKNITVNGLTVAGSHEIKVTKVSGAFVFNGTTGTLKIENSTFKGSSGHGLVINGHNGHVTLNKVTAQSNTLDGARISNTAGSAGVSVIKSKFQKNGDNGLWVQSNGQIVLGAVTSQKNGEKGAQLVSGGLILLEANGSGKNKFDSNGDDGLYAATDDIISVTDTSASKNGDMGLQLVNDAGTANISVGSFDSPSKFDSNAQAGLFIQTAGDAAIRQFSASKNLGWGMTVLSDGSITVTNANVNDNGTNGGAILVNYTGTGSVSITTSVTKMNHFDGNKGVAGLSILSSGFVLIADVSASKNVNAIGLQVSTAASTILLTTANTPFNHFDGNAHEGMSLSTTGGGVIVQYSTASSNGKGAIYDGANLTTSNGSATFKCSTFSKNTGNGIDAALGTGNITLNGVIATANGQTNIVSSDLTPTIGACP